MGWLAVRIAVDQRDRLYERHPTELQVFISSQMRDGVLDGERRRAVSTVSALTGFRPWSWEQDATAGPYCSEGMCIGNARASDALVLILSEELTPVTRKEYEAATSNQVQCFIFLKQGCKLTDNAQRFVDAEQKTRATTEFFGSLDELEFRLRRALLVAAARGWRITSMLHADDAVARGLDLPAYMLADNLAEITVEVDGAEVSVQQIIDDQRDRVQRGLHSDVYDELWPLADQLREWGYVAAAAAVLHEIEDLVGDRIDARQHAWLLNCAGICLSSQGDQAKALKAYEEMRALGVQIDDSDVISTALQNLGVIAHIQGRMEDAGKFELEAVQIKLENDDTLAAAQLILNCASTGLERWGPDKTEKFLDSMDWVIVGVGDAGLRSSLEGLRGLVEVRRGNLNAARRRFSTSLRHARRSGSTSREIQAMHSLGHVDLDRGKPKAAARWFQKGADLAEAIGDPQLRMRMQEGLAASLHAQGHHGEALDALTQALNWPLGGTVRAELALALGAQLVDIDHERAVSLLTEAIALSSDAERTDLLNEAHSQMAVVEASTGKADTAIERVRAVVGGIEDAQVRARVWRNVARHTAQAAPDTAAKMFRCQLDELANTRLSRAQRGWESATAAAVLLDAGAAATALEFFDVAVDLNRRGDKESRFSITNDRANTLMTLGRYPEARVGYARCHKLALQASRVDLQIQALANAGECERRSGRVLEAVNRLEAARSLLDEIDADDDTRAWVLDNLGLAYLDAQRIDDADAIFTTALAHARAAKSAHREASALASLASVARERGQYRRAIQRYRQALARDEQVDLHRVEALGSLLACYGVLADEQHTESVAQQLVDAAQATGTEAAGSERLAWAARQWLEHDLNAAADLYAVAILLAGVGALRSSDQDMLNAVAMSVAVVGHHTLDGVPKAHPAFGRRLARALKRQSSEKDMDWSFVEQMWDAFREAAVAVN